MWRRFVRSSTGVPFGMPFGRRMYSTPAPKKRMSMKELVKQYGWTATGVYCALMAIDLPLSFVFVHSLGKDTLIDWEQSVRGWVGVDTARDNTYISRASTGNKGMWLTEFGIAYVIHKALIVVRLPLTVALTPRVATTLQRYGFKVNRAIPKVDNAKLAEQMAKVKKGNHPLSSEAPKLPSSSPNIPKSQNPADPLKTSPKPPQQQSAPASDVNDKFGRPPTKKNKWFMGLF